MLESLKNDVCQANRLLARRGLGIGTWGNVSGIDPATRLVAIKPSGVPFDRLTPDGIVVVDLDGTPVEGNLRPSTDLPTHLAIYRAWPDVLGIAHAHSLHATMFAQAMRPIPCLGTTHADHFHNEVPLTRELTPDEIANEYERNTGEVIVERFAGVDPMEIPAVLVAHHGPFTWGSSATEAAENAAVLEVVAEMAYGTIVLSPWIDPAPAPLVEKHYCRKHGRHAYYGQSAKGMVQGSRFKRSRLTESDRNRPRIPTMNMPWHETSPSASKEAKP